MSPSPVPVERIERAILFLRGHKVMLDSDLAALYGVETRVLVQAVKRNPERFPKDFMFQLTNQESANWRSQIVMSNSAPGYKTLDVVRPEIRQASVEIAAHLVEHTHDLHGFAPRAVDDRVGIDSHQLVARAATFTPHTDARLLLQRPGCFKDNRHDAYRRRDAELRVKRVD